MELTDMVTESVKCIATLKDGYSPLGDFTIMSLSRKTFPKGSLDLWARRERVGREGGREGGSDKVQS